MTTTPRRLVPLPQRLAPPPWEPVALSEAKRQCRVADALTHDDGLISGLVQSARAILERDLDVVFCAGDFLWIANYKANDPDAVLTGFPPDASPIRLPVRNATAVKSIVYVDEAGATQTLDPSKYQIVTGLQWPAVELVDRASGWPSFDPFPLATVKITYTAGYPDPGSIPPDLLWILKGYIYHGYEYGESEMGALAGQLSLAQPYSY